jgi:hypothetical protein
MPAVSPAHRDEDVAERSESAAGTHHVKTNTITNVDTPDPTAARSPAPTVLDAFDEDGRPIETFVEVLRACQKMSRAFARNSEFPSAIRDGFLLLSKFAGPIEQRIKAFWDLKLWAADGKLWAADGRIGLRPDVLPLAPLLAELLSLIADLGAALATWRDEIRADAASIDHAAAELRAGRATVSGDAWEVLKR